MSRERKGKEVKVTDRRMFTPEGNLREGFRYLEEDPSRPGGTSVDSPVERRSGSTSQVEPGDAKVVSGERLQSSPEAASFMALLSVLADPVPLFLGDARLPDGSSAENLDLAQFHIDLLEILQKKTVGNLSTEEASLLEDLLYRFRLRYVQKCR